MPHTHSTHDHVHGIKCGHTAIRHGDHVDYLHDGHLHHQGKNEVIEEHVLVVGCHQSCYMYRWSRAQRPLD